MIVVLLKIKCFVSMMWYRTKEKTGSYGRPVEIM